MVFQALTLAAEGYELVSTKISASNPRSLRAHAKAGYEEVKRVEGGGIRGVPEVWVVVEQRFSRLLVPVTSESDSAGATPA